MTNMELLRQLATRVAHLPVRGASAGPLRDPAEERLAELWQRIEVGIAQFVEAAPEAAAAIRAEPWRSTPAEVERIIAIAAVEHTRAGPSDRRNDDLTGNPGDDA